MLDLKGPVRSFSGFAHSPTSGSVEEDNDDEADDVGGQDKHDYEDQPALIVQDVSQEPGKDNLHLLS